MKRTVEVICTPKGSNFWGAYHFDCPKIIKSLKRLFIITTVLLTFSFAKEKVSASPASLSTYTKSIFTARADNIMLAFSFRESQDCFTMGAFSVNVSFSVAELITAELKESAEFLIFASAFLYVS